MQYLYTIGMNTVSASSSPSIAARIISPVARLWQWIQNKIANILGFKNAGNLAAVVAIIGLTTVGVSNILAPSVATAVSSVWTWIATIGGAGLVENKLTERAANLDGNGKV